LGRTLTTNARHPVIAASRHAAIYTRISRDAEGKALGVERQEQDCIDLAKRLGYTSWEVFTDNDVSASTLSKKLRPEFARMMSDVGSGRFQAIIAYSNSRLTRRVVELHTLMDVTQKTHVRIHTVASGQHDLDTADGRATMLTIAVWDQAEAERTAERVKRASLQRQEDGRWHGGVPPFGFFKEDKALHVKDAEADLIREAASRVLDQDETLYSIAKDWNKRGVTTRQGAPWKHSVLRNVLTTEAVIGLNKAGVSAWEPILDVGIHHRLVDRLAPDSSRRTNPLGVKSSKYALGGGLVVCACHKPLATVAREKQGTVKLVCRTFMNGPDEANHPRACRLKSRVEYDTGRVSIDYEELEAYLHRRCLAHLDDLPFWDAVKRKRETADTDTSDLRAEREAQKLERENVLTQHRLGAIGDERLMADIAQIDSEVIRLTREIERSHGGATAHDVWTGRRDALAQWEHWTAAERRLLFRSLIERVVVTGWPEGIPTTTLPRKGEPQEDFQCRRWMGATRAMIKRVKIEWSD
jgi:DNA invertase Pin-like site-specific DNA recombinase